MDEKFRSTRPRIIIHGGAGNITHGNLTPESYKAYRRALLDILHSANNLLSQPDACAIDVASYAVSLLENSPLFNCGHGAVFTTAGTNELEASIMVSRGKRKRGVGVMKVTRVRNPIMLAKKMLSEGENDNGGGAQGHCQLEGEICHDLARKWQLEMCEPSYYWTKRRWDEHRRGLGKSTDDETYCRDRKRIDGLKRELLSEIDGSLREADFADPDPSWDGHEYLPQGTVGCVVLDSSGTICVATSTGGLTNKLPGRIGDTPTIGAGFWAEEWQTTPSKTFAVPPSPLEQLFRNCLPSIWGWPYQAVQQDERFSRSKHAVAMSGTGNGDSFLRLAACRTAGAISRFTGASLQAAVTAVAGPGGELQQSAGDRWKTGEGEGGIIGIDYRNDAGVVVADFNCGGMFRAWIDEKGIDRMMVFRDEY